MARYELAGCRPASGVGMQMGAEQKRRGFMNAIS
jgi:hypothetical protein